MGMSLALSSIRLDPLYNNIANLFGGASFYAPLTHSAIPNVSASGTTATFTRATTATVRDHEGVLRTAIAGEARFEGARRVRNLVTGSSENWTNAYYTKQGAGTGTLPAVTANYSANPIDGAVTASRVILDIGAGTTGGDFSRIFNNGGISYGAGSLRSLYAKSNTQDSYVINWGLSGSMQLKTITPEWTRLTSVVANNYPDMFLIGNLATSKYADISVFGEQVEDVTAQTTQTAGEYVSVGVPSDWQGTELVTNGTFDSGTTGWTAGLSAVLSVVSNEMQIENGGASFGYAYTSITTVVGSKYVVSALSRVGTTVAIQLAAGTTPADTSLGSTSTASATNTLLTFTFTATGTTTYITFQNQTNTAGHTSYADNVSVKVAYYHGSFVDGVKCFNTDINGTPIPASTLKGYLAEGARENLLPDSQVFSSWTDDGTTITDNAIAAPDGTITADKMVETSANSSHGRYKSISITSGNVYTCSWYAKKGERDYVAINHNGTGGYAASYWNLNAGVVQSSGAGHTNSIELVGGDWYRCKHTFTAGITAAVVFDLLNSDTGARLSYTGDITKGIYLWGAQLELGSFASSYIATTTAAVTRNADVLTYTGGDIANLKTLMAAEFRREVGVNSVGYHYALRNITTTNYVEAPFLDATQYRMDGGPGPWLAISTYAPGTTVSAAQSWATNDIKMSFNGVTVAPDTSAVAPTGMTHLEVGHFNSGLQFSGNVGGIYGWTRNFSQSELNTVTA